MFMHISWMASRMSFVTAACAASPVRTASSSVTQALTTRMYFTSAGRSIRTTLGMVTPGSDPFHHEQGLVVIQIAAALKVAYGVGQRFPDLRCTLTVHAVHHG